MSPVKKKPTSDDTGTVSRILQVLQCFSEQELAAFLGERGLEWKHLCHDEPHPDSPAGGI